MKLDRGPKVARVTGQLEYADDVTPADTLHGAFVRLPEARARLISIDTRAAERMDGVRRIFTAEDFGPDGPPRFGQAVRDQPLLAAGQTRYCGEPVALVVATTREMAIAAAEAVRVEREELPGWHTVAGALSAEALHDGEYALRASGEAAQNVMGRWDYGWGVMEEARAASSLIVENRYTAPFAHHFAIETYSAIGIPDGPGVTVWDTVQHPFQLRAVIAATLDLPICDVRVRAMPMGGSFGSKGYAKLGPAAAYFCRELGQPLKITLSSEEAFLTGQREACEIVVETGFDAEGVLQFQDLRADFLIGAYADISARVVSKSALHACSPYRTPAAAVRARAIYTTTPPTTAFRGFGAPHMVMAIEAQMDEAAERLDLDPVELRLRNMKQKGEPTVPHESAIDGDWPGLVSKAADALGWETDPVPGRGRGIAFGIKSCVPATSSQALVRMFADGSVKAFVGTSEMGQGAVITYVQMVSDWLGIPVEKVQIEMADTGVVPFDSLTASSRSLVHMGRALERAVEDLKRSLAERAAPLGGVGSEDVRFAHGRVHAGEWSGSFADLLAADLGLIGGEVTGHGEFRAPLDPANPLGGETPFFEAVATGVELSVDRETGMIELHRVVHATDAGHVFNRDRAIGLDEGGVAMGIGLALSEQLVYEEGRLMNGSSLDYRIPTVGDAPRESISLFQENGDGPGPLGSKGLAEGGVLAVAPALMAAVHDAVGVRIRDLPLSPEMIWRALQQEAAGVTP